MKRLAPSGCTCRVCPLVVAATPVLLRWFDFQACPTPSPQGRGPLQTCLEVLFPGRQRRRPSELQPPKMPIALRDRHRGRYPRRNPRAVHPDRHNRCSGRKKQVFRPSPAGFDGHARGLHTEQGNQPPSWPSNASAPTGQGCRTACCGRIFSCRTCHDGIRRSRAVRATISTPPTSPGQSYLSTPLDCADHERTDHEWQCGFSSSPENR